MAAQSDDPLRVYGFSHLQAHQFISRRTELLLFVFITMLLIECPLSFAQEENTVTREMLCRYYPSAFSSFTMPARITTFTSNDEAQDIVDQIVEAVTGMSRRFEVREAPILKNNAAAAVCNDQRYVFYGGDFIESIIYKTDSYWSAIGIMAHEVGHHMHGHTLDDEGSKPDIELEADHFLGFVLQKLGASIEEAKMGMGLIASPFGSDSHPPREKRLAKIEEGWLKSCADDPLCDPGGSTETPPSSTIEGAYEYRFTNKCKYPVRLAIQYYDTTETWQKAGWWSFSPGESALLSSGGGKLMSRNPSWYYYAETTDGPELIWGGDHGVNFGGKYIEMKKMKDSSGVNEWSVSCEGK